MSKVLMFVGILLMIGNAFSFYNKSYDGYTFILPEPSAEYWGSKLKPMQLSFSGAQSWCSENVAGSTLATIPNSKVQQNITDFIESAWQNKNLGGSGNDNIRLNGEFHLNTEWRWVNGQPKAAELTVREQNGNSNSYARLDGKNYSIYSRNERPYCYAICEYQGNSKHCDLFLNGRCYQKEQYRYNWLNWHDVGNKCSDGGGILASLETLSDANINVSLKNLSLQSNAVYCIGLQKNEWRWGDSGVTIGYNNWPFSRRFNFYLRCLCLTRLTWQWTECDCATTYPFICMLNDMPGSPTQANKETSTSSETIQFVILAVSCAVIFVVIIIIVAALIIKKRRNSDPQRALMSSGYVTPKHAVTESSMDFPVYEEIIQNHKETSITASDATYASVVRKTVAKTEEEEHPVNSIVYAELDLTSKE